MSSTPHPAQQQQKTKQLVQQQGQGANHLRQPVDTGDHQAVTNQNQNSMVSASTSDLNTPTDRCIRNINN